jgi:hypothetical protein
MLTLAERFWCKVDKRGPDECWPWLASRNEDGYGTFGVDGKTVKASRFAWELANGRPMPDGMEGCHSCDFPPCCNPDHVYPGTHAENMQDMVAKGRWRGPSLEVIRAARGKLTVEQVAQVRERLAAGEPQESIANAFGVTQGAISYINSRTTWSETGGPEGRHTSESRGRRNGRAHLTEDQVREIRRKAEPIKVQAARYGVNRGTIEAIRARRIWAHVS